MEQRRRRSQCVGKVDSGGGAVVLTDMFGGTPSDLAISVMDNAKVEVIAGVNLPMLIKLASVRRREARTHGRGCPGSRPKYINVASQILADGRANEPARHRRTASPPPPEPRGGVTRLVNIRTRRAARARRRKVCQARLQFDAEVSVVKRDAGVSGSRSWADDARRRSGRSHRARRRRARSRRVAVEALAHLIASKFDEEDARIARSRRRRRDGRPGNERLTGIGVSPGHRDRPGLYRRRGALPVKETAMKRPGWRPNRRVSAEAVAVSVEQLASSSASHRAARLDGRRVWRPARRASRDAGELAADPRRRSAHRQPADQCRARDPARNRGNWKILCGDRTSLSRGPQR